MKAAVAPLSVVLVFMIPAGLNKLLTRTHWVDLQLPAGTTIRSTSSAVVGLCCMSFSVLVGMLVALYGKPDANTVAGVAFAVSMALPGGWFLVRMSARWQWDNEGLTFTSWMGKRFISWPQVAKVDRDAFNRRVVVGNDGQKIVWAMSDVIGSEWMERALSRSRPDLALPSDPQ